MSKRYPQILAVTLAPYLMGAAQASSTANTGSPALPVSPWEVLQVAMGMGLVILAIVGCAWLARRLLHMPAGVHGQLRIISGVSMGTREKVVLMQVGDKQLLLGVAPGRIQTLHVLERPIDSNDTIETPGSGFSAQLGHALKQAVRGQRG